MEKYQQQQKEADAEASTHQEKFEENNTVHIDIADRTKFSPDGTLGSEDMTISALSPEFLSFNIDAKYRREMHAIEMRTKKPSSKIETDAIQVQATKSPPLLKDAYLLIKAGITSGSARWERVTNETDIFQQKSPLGNTVLHLAAAYHGNSAWVAKVAEKAPQLLTDKNSNGDMALHVAAAGGNISFLKNLFDAHLRNVNFSDPECLQKALNEILTKNKLGNTFIHEALLNGHKDVMHFISSNEDARLPLAYKEMVALAASFQTNNQDKSILYLTIEAGYKEAADEILTKLANPTLLNELIKGYPGFDKVIPPNLHPDVNVPTGKSPLVAAIVKQDKEILDLIVKKKPAWVTSRDTEGRTPLHVAASVGYLNGVQCLLRKCASCATERDNHGYVPLHLASDGGHVEVVKELLKEEYCLNPRELLANRSQNFLHLAVASGKFSVVRFILKSTDKELGDMINDQDANGNTPLHLATLCCHPKIVHALTWDKRVKLTLVNEKNQTALDVCTQPSLQNPSFRQRLTWTALKSAGVPYADPQPSSIKAYSQSTKNLWEEEAPKMDQYKDRISTLILVSTLIITVTFAAGFTLPGGVKSSDPGQGMALMLHRMLFKVFIFCITISMYGAISVTIILIWAQLGDLTMAILALDVAKYCLGVTLATLSLAFLAGVHLVISDLSWLATTTLIMSITFIIMLLLLYILLWLPSTSSKSIVRLISYYPFLMLASLAERQQKVPLAERQQKASESEEVNAGNNATKEDIGAQSQI